MKKVCVILAGSGHADGSEIQESVSTLIALSKYDVSYDCFSLDQDQYDVIDHFTSEPVEEKRNLMHEAARIARGRIRDISKLDINNYSAIIFPGGFGAAKNLCTYAFEGKNGSVDERIKKLIIDFHSQGKYVGAICISPVMIGMALSGVSEGLKLTPGFVENAAEDMKYFGAEPMLLNSEDICIDEKNKVISAPAYMNGNATLFQVYSGIEKLIKYISERI
ncbi:MAG: isoprenoid biosynthesis glyoxalase ElbB [Candidatus Delongbacteria bacterium]|nr:isoprenoid biosynthesis glyoxalase ElbB [Candidatus Delongbacteria bacterium]